MDDLRDLCTTHWVHSLPLSRGDNVGHDGCGSKYYKSFTRDQEIEANSQPGAMALHRTPSSL